MIYILKTFIKQHHRGTEHVQVGGEEKNNERKTDTEGETSGLMPHAEGQTHAEVAQLVQLRLFQMSSLL